METFEVRVAIFEPEPQELIVYQKAHHVMNAITKTLAELPATDRGHRATSVYAFPVEINNPHHATSNRSEEIPVIT